MANTCFNYIQAFGDAEAIEKLNFDLADDKYEEDFYVDLGGLKNEADKITFTTETRWAPPREWVKKASEEYGLLIECEYEECGSDIAGKFVYAKGLLSTSLDFTYLEGKYHFLDWYEFIECEVLNRLEEEISLEEFLEDYTFCNEDEIKELKEIYNGTN